MTPKRMNQVLKISLGLIIIVVAVGLYFANARLSAMAHKTATLKAEVEVGQKQLAIYQQTKAKVDSLDYVNELADKVLPATEDQSLVVAELSQFARRSNLSVSQINFTEVASTKTSAAAPKGVIVSPISVEIKAGAKYNDLLDFLKAIEQNRRKMQVTNISLSPDTNDRTRLSQVTININLYSRQTSGAKQ